jgi:hypothetical protein
MPGVKGPNAGGRPFLTVHDFTRPPVDTPAIPSSSMFEILNREELRLMRGPGWWIALAAVAALLSYEQNLPPGTMTSLGLQVSLIFVVAAEAWRRAKPGDARAMVRSQSLSGAAIALLGVATGAVSAQLRAGVLTTAMPYVWFIWTVSFILVTLASAQIFVAVRRVIVNGRRDTDLLVATEREALEAELLVQQQKLEPELVLRAMAVIADQAARAPRDAEASVELLAAFLRKSLTAAPALSAPLNDEVTRAREYERILAAAGVHIPITWKIDDNVQDVVVPGGTLRTFLDYAVSRCLRTPGAGVTVSALQHARRFYLIVKDNAAPDPPMLEEPTGLTNLRRRLGATPKRRVRVETSAMFEVDGTAAGTTQTLSLRLPEAA